MFFDLEIRKKHFVNLRGLKLDLREHDFDKWASTGENLSRGFRPCHSNQPAQLQRL